MFQREGITNIKVADYLWGRWFNKSISIDYKNTVDKLQYNLTNRFLAVFLRMNQHFNNFNITSYPNDIDSFLHLSIPEKLIVNESTTKGEARLILESAYLSGLGEIKSSSKRI